MENTLENKAKFFALYFGQKVEDYKSLTFGPLTELDTFSFTNKSIEKNMIVLKSVSEISEKDDDDLRTLMRVTTPKKNSCSLEVHEESSYMAVDFLRSKGYAIPWMGVPVETLVYWGWVRLLIE